MLLNLEDKHISTETRKVGMQGMYVVMMISGQTRPISDNNANNTSLFLLDCELFSIRIRNVMAWSAESAFVIPNILNETCIVSESKSFPLILLVKPMFLPAIHSFS